MLVQPGTGIKTGLFMAERGGGRVIPNAVKNPFPE